MTETEALMEISLIKVDMAEALDPIALFRHLNRAIKIASAALNAPESAALRQTECEVVDVTATPALLAPHPTETDGRV